MDLDDLVQKYTSSVNEDLELLGDEYPEELAKMTLEYLETLKRKIQAKIQNNF